MLFLFYFFFNFGHIYNLRPLVPCYLHGYIYSTSSFPSLQELFHVGSSLHMWNDHCFLPASKKTFILWLYNFWIHIKYYLLFSAVVVCSPELFQLWSLKTRACFYNYFLLIIVPTIFIAKANPVLLHDSSFPFCSAVVATHVIKERDCWRLP